MNVAKNALYNILGFAVPIALSLLTVPMYLHSIGQERYGVLSISWLFMGYFGLFDFGLGRAVTHRLSSLVNIDNTKRSEIFFSAMAVSLTLSIVGSAILYFIGNFFFGYQLKVDESLRREIISAIPLLALAVPVATSSGILLGTLQSQQRFFVGNIISASSTIAFQLFPLIVAWIYGPNLFLLLGSGLAARVVGIAGLAIAVSTDLAPPAKVNFSECRRLIKYGGWVAITSVIGPILMITDRFFIGATLGAAAVAAYTIPAQLADRIQTIPQAVVGALFPALSASDKEAADRLIDDAFRSMISLLTLPITLAIFLLPWLLHLWLGDDVPRDSGLIGQILVIGYWANASAFISYAWLQAMGRPDLVTKALAFEIPIYLILLWLSLRYFGLAGAAAALSVRYIIDLLVLSRLGHLNSYPITSISIFIIMFISLSLSEQVEFASLLWYSLAIGCCGAAAIFSWIFAPRSGRQFVKNRLKRSLDRMGP